MTYVARGGRVWAMPYGAEYIGEDSSGVPLYFQGSGLSQAKPVTPRSIGKGYIDGA